MLTNQCSLALLTRSPPEAITGHMRATFTAWGNTPKGEMEMMTAAFEVETKAARHADQEDHPPPPDRPKNTVAIYTDGSYARDTRSGGIGVVAVENGTTTEDEDAVPIMRIWRPVPAEDNNDTEIAVVLAAVKWAVRRLDPSRSVYVYTDSMYTRNTILGIHPAKTPAAKELSNLWKKPISA